MAERRMFAKTIVLSDAFLDMPMSARCLYFTLGMLADDDGFINSPRSIMRQCGASDDDMKLLITKKFVLIYETGIIVIKHWRINNYLRSDRYTETKCKNEKAMLSLDENGSYTTNSTGIPAGTPTVYQTDTNGIPSIGKDRIVKDSVVKDSTGKDRGVGEGTTLPPYHAENDDSYLASWMRMHPGEPIPPAVRDIEKIFGGMRNA